MKRIFMPIVFLCSLSLVSFLTREVNLLDYNEALEVGVNKYLKFLWMVDGAFNSERYNEDFTVNGISLKDEDKVFTCKYKNKSKECISDNFENEFKKLFAKNINYAMVYTDQAIYTWIFVKDGKYVFKNLNNCNVDRMGIKHNIKVTSIKGNKIDYEISFEKRQTNQINKRDFTLILEDGDWKISNAFYYDLCGMRYIIY